MGRSRKRPAPAKPPRICGDCADPLPADSARPEIEKGLSIRCSGCGLELCPKCIRMGIDGRAWCEDCAEDAGENVSPVCHKCGCTEYDACTGGCWWDYDPTKDEAPLCSACLTEKKPTKG